MPGPTKSRLLLFTTALLFSTGGAAIKACSFSSWQIAGFRAGIAAAVLYALLPDARPSAKTPWTARTWLIGCAYAAAVILFVLANKLTTAANAIFLQSTAPLYLLLLGPFVLREPIRKVDIAVIATVAAGAVLLLRGAAMAAPTAPDPGRGNMLALGAGAAWALTLTGLRWMGKHSREDGPGMSTVLAGNLIAFAVSLAVMVLLRGTESGGSAGIGSFAVLFYLGVFQVALAYVCLTRSLREATGLEAATLLLIEPVLNPLWTWLIHGERPGHPALIGGALIIGAAFAGTVWRLRHAV